MAEGERGNGRGRRWTRDELLVAFNLYCRLPFGQLHQHNPQIIDLAGRLGRTPSSVGMKLCNFASLDPALAARGIKGLAGAAQADRQVFEEFAADWPRFAIESEEARERLGISPASGAGLHPAGESLPQQGAAPTPAPSPAPRGRGLGRGLPPLPLLQASSLSDEASPLAPDGRPTEAFATVRQRRLQGLFRDSVLAAYDGACCISGICLPQLLQASHIIPWAADESRRLTPTNGLALSALHDRAFDRGLITLDEDLRVVVSGQLRVGTPTEIYRVSLLEIEGRAIRQPTRWAPDPAALAWHRERIFVA